MTLKAVGRPFVLDLTHNVVCASTGRCACTQKEIARRTRDESGRPSVRYEYALVPSSVTLLAGMPQDVPDAVGTIPRVQRALKAGRIVAC